MFLCSGISTTHSVDWERCVPCLRSNHDCRMHPTSIPPQLSKPMPLLSDTNFTARAAAKLTDNEIAKANVEREKEFLCLFEFTDESKTKAQLRVIVQRQDQKKFWQPKLPITVNVTDKRKLD